MGQNGEQNGAGRGAAELSVESFRAELDVFSGPLDLLLYLIRRQNLRVANPQCATGFVTQMTSIAIPLLAEDSPAHVGRIIVGHCFTPPSAWVRSELSQDCDLLDHFFSV